MLRPVQLKFPRPGPVHLAAALLLLLVAGGASLRAQVPAPAAGQPIVLFLGDSLTAGYGLDNPDTEAFPALIQQFITAAGLPERAVNAGVSGDTTAGGLRRADWVLRGPIELVVLELGANDGLRGLPLAQTRANLDAIIARAKQRYPHVQIVLAGMRLPPNLGADYTNGFAAVFPAVEQDNPGAILMPFLLADVGGDPNLNQPDHIHPTAAGDRVIAANLWKVLEPILRAAHPK